MNKTITWTQFSALINKAWAIKDGDDRVSIYFNFTSNSLSLQFNAADDSEFEDLCVNESENKNIEYNGSEVLLKTSDGEILWLMPLYELYVEEVLKLFNI